MADLIHRRREGAFEVEIKRNVCQREGGALDGE